MEVRSGEKAHLAPVSRLAQSSCTINVGHQILSKARVVGLRRPPRPPLSPVRRLALARSASKACSKRSLSWSASCRSGRRLNASFSLRGRSHASRMKGATLHPPWADVNHAGSFPMLTLHGRYPC